MTTPSLPADITAQLLSLGIPAEKHNLEDLRRMIPFGSTHPVQDLQALAQVVIYLGQHRILSLKTNSWKSLPWGMHACLFYKDGSELTEPFRNYFKEGLLSREKCVWIVPKAYDMEKAKELRQSLLTETQKNSDVFELYRHEDWYELPSGRFRSMKEILAGWLNKIEGALHEGFRGLRVAGDAHFKPDDLQNFFEYERGVNNSMGTLKMKALCTYCLPQFAPGHISQILSSHQSAFGDFAISQN